MDRPDDMRANDQSTIGKPGDPLMDPKTEPGYILLGLGLVTFALALIAAANGLMGWMAISIAICVVSVVGGLAWVLYERGRMKEVMRHRPRRVPPRLRRLWRSSDGA
ncbi:MAG: hypothetical protein LLG14_03470 [Nocardiaceae bacterium]|nr:hypothetical protein [Nocardiaceae bacterium]